jgi:two-component system KDP operon response regulator KdpE
MKSRGRVLVVDDEPRLVRLVREILIATGYDVLVGCNGQQAVDLVALEQPDLVILDIILNGDMDGYEVTKQIRTFSEVPILMLTARVREVDLLRGFDFGADDYMTKPFSSKELLARVRALLKRSLKDMENEKEVELSCGEINIDLARHRVTLSGTEIHLTRTEYNLLHELARHHNQVLLHEQLLTAVWGSEYRNDTDYLRAYIHALRQKLEPDPENPRWIVRCPGVGYMLVCREEAIGDR